MSWSVPRKGGQKETALLLCGVSGALALVPALRLPEEEKLAQPPRETSPRHRTEGTACRDPRSPVPAVSQPWCSSTCWLCSEDVIPEPHAEPAAKAAWPAVASCGQRLLKAAQMCSTEADGLAQGEIYDLLKSPQLDGCFFISYKSNNGRTEQILNVFRECACCCPSLRFLCSRKQHVG